MQKEEGRRQQGRRSQKTPTHTLLPDLAPTGPSLADTTFLRSLWAGPGVRSPEPQSKLCPEPVCSSVKQAIWHPMSPRPRSRTMMPGLGGPRLVARRVGSSAGHSQLLVVRVVQCCPLVLLMWLPLDGLVVGVQVGATEAVIVLQETWREGTPTWALGPTPQLEEGSAPRRVQQASRVPGEGAPGGCQGGVCTRAMLRGKEPGPGESGPWGGQGGDGARGGCGGRAVTVPGSCLIIPFSIWALRVLGGDSECFLFLEGCVGSLDGQRCAPWGAGSP